MKLDDAHCYRALSARDQRFDGAFFVGVTTTGIYCRPICPARTPLASRCRFFASAAAAERRGFRPCLRCRPELAPATGTIAKVRAGSFVESQPQPERTTRPALPSASNATASVDIVRARAIEAGELIAAGALDDGALDELASQLGVSARHVRRVVEREFGASPIALAQTRRLLTAKQLLTDTSLPLSAVAMASGFGSVRRFNALFRARYRLAPGDLRRVGTATAHAHDMSEHDDAAVVRVALAPRPPFDWPSMREYLRARAIPGVEYVDARYHRVVQIASRSSPSVMHAGIVSVGAEGRHARLYADISLSLLPVLVTVLTRLRRLLDLDAAPQVIASHLANDPMLARAVAARPGQRVPGAAHAFELAVRAVLGQQVSVRGATTLAGRLMQVICEPLPQAIELDGNARALTHLPISADRLADASVTMIASTGLPQARAQTLQRMARAVAEGEVHGLDDAFTGTVNLRAFEEAFTALPGIGPWTAQSVAMRALRIPDAFPESDLALRKAAGGLSAGKLRERAEDWRPWRAYAAMHLWGTLEPAKAGTYRNGMRS